MRILVAYASRHGATRVIAAVVGHALERVGHDVEICPVDDVTGVAEYDAVVLGSAVYRRRWLPEAASFVTRHKEDLAARPVWLFSSGPLGADPRRRRRTQAPAKDVAPLQASVVPRGHILFPGALDPAELTTRERAVRRLPSARAELPAGDYRNWDEIRAWALSVGDELGAPEKMGA